MPASSSAVPTDEVYRELGRLDTKCGALAGLTGAGATFLASTMPAKTGTGVLIMLTGASLMLGLATVVLLKTMRPRLGPTGFNRYAVGDPAELAAELDAEAAAAADGGCSVPAAQNLQILSQICVRKNRMLAAAIDMVIVAVVFIAAAAVLAALT